MAANVEVVTEFKCLESLVEVHGRMTGEINHQIHRL